MIHNDPPEIEPVADYEQRWSEYTPPKVCRVCLGQGGVVRFLPGRSTFENCAACGGTGVEHGTQ